MRVLLSMWSVNYDRLFEPALRELLRRGHSVHVVFETDKDGLSGDTRLFEQLRDELGGLSWSVAPARRNRVVRGLRRRLRTTIDLLRYWEPAFEDAHALRGRALERVPGTVRIAAPLFRTARLRRLARDLFRRLDRALPVDPAVEEVVTAQEPDLVVATPLVMLGSAQSEYVRAARERGIPAAFVVASWDNLTNKGVVHDEPDLTLVWNEAQRQEAADLHGLAPARVVATGAHSYDHWFGWEASRTREELAASLGLDPARALLVYACSSPFIARHEAETVARWVTLVRSADDPRLRDASIVIRPHPANPQPWNVEEPGRTVVWPPVGTKPTALQAKRNYYDTLRHADAVVGINTSALVESAIVGTPSYSLLEADLHGSQEGTLHFAHLTALHTARTPEQHLAQLAAALGREVDGTAERAFVETFLRPRGLDRAASPLLVDELERLASGGRRILFTLDHPGFLLHFDETIGELARRGNDVHLAFARPEKWPDGLSAIDRTNVTVHDHIPGRTVLPRVARGVRRLADYVHYLDPALTGAVYARAKWRKLARLAGPLATRDQLPRPAVRALLALLAGVERLLPPERAIDRFIESVAPDAVVVSPLVDARTDLADYLQAARRLGVPSALAVASWDNLSSKGLIRVVPDRVFVWNETQRHEAASFHHVPPDRITVTGAQPYDRWFGRSPSTTFEEFCERRGLPGVRKLVLFAGSTRQHQEPELETDFVGAWCEALRENAAFDDVGLLVRPHPTNLDAWADVDLGERTAIWLRTRGLPIADKDRTEYYDALYHASAVVAINSTALLEAAILDRPAHTVALPAFRELQHDLLHYHYLLPANGGFLREAAALEEHVRLLAEDVSEPAAGSAQRRSFVGSFIRPQGLEEASAPHLVDGIEGLARYR